MRQLTAFIKKEFLEQLRSGKMIILIIIFCMFGIMNPAIAKLTPWMVDIMSDQLSGSGLVVGNVEVDALTSWTQFFKNMPIALVIFIIMFSGIMAAEYQKKTLINIVTKGMKRWKILASKAVVMVVFWTVGCLTGFLITYGYNAYFWDNSTVPYIVFATLIYYLFGMWLISVILLASSVCNTAGTVTLSVLAAFIITYLLAMIPNVNKYMPSHLIESNALILNTSLPGDYTTAIAVTVVLIFINLIMSVVAFARKTL